MPSSVIPDAFSVIPDAPSVIPDAPSVIPDIFNRESRFFPKQGYTKEGMEEKTGFPLTTCGNDRWGNLRE